LSSIVSAIYLWLFALGWTTQQYWQSALAVGLAIASVYVFRNRGGSAIALVSITSSVLVIVSTRWPLSQTISFDPFSGLRIQLTSMVTGVTKDAGALVLGLTLGDDGQVSQQLREAMRVTSLTHLMAVSGANCAIVVAAAYFAARKFSYRIRAIVSIGALLAYVALVGLQPSVLRAAVMAIAALLALVAGRRINPLSALALSVLVLLSLDPTLASSYGFTLSVLATAGLLVVSPALYQRLSQKMPKWLAMSLSVSTAAQLFCFPVLLGLQGGVPTYSLFANLLCEPLVAPITVIGLLATMFFWVPPLASTLFWLAALIAWPISLIAHGLAGLPFATMPWRLDGSGIVAALMLVSAVLVFLYSKTISKRNISALVMVTLLACSLGVVINQAVRISLWPMSGWQVASCDVGQGDATVIRDGDSVALIDVGRDEKKINSCLSKLGILRIDLLVLTHFDADHVNGLAGAIKSRLVRNALLTSFADDRPGADFSRFELANRGIPITRAEAGMHGAIAGVNWKVLSPSRTALEAEDSNDGSVTMLFRLKNFQLITLADLGEKGQMRLAANIGTWWTDPKLPLVMKVAHHGSADQYPEFIEWLKPKLALVSVGAHNGYGHPTKRALDTLRRAGSTVLRTDLLGSVAIKNPSGTFEVSYSGSS